MILKTPLFRLFIFNFLISDAIVASPACSKLIENAGFRLKYHIITAYNKSGTEKLIQAGLDIKGRTGISQQEGLKSIEGWITRYTAYQADLALIDGALARYLGDPAQSDPVRQKGRLNILREAYQNDPTPFKTLSDRILFWPYPDYQTDTGRPIVSAKLRTLILPRRPDWEKGEDGKRVIRLQRFGDIHVQWTMSSFTELRDEFLRVDERDVRLLEKMRVDRELDQAILYSQIRRVRSLFPEGSYRKIKRSLERIEAENLNQKSQGLSPPPDPLLSDVYRTLRIMEASSKIVYDPQFAHLKPSADALEFVDQVTGTDRSNNYIFIRSSLDRFKKFFGKIPEAGSMVQSKLKPYQTPLIVWGAIVSLINAWAGYINWTHHNVVQPTYNYIVYDPEELRARHQLAFLQKMRLEIAVPARSMEDFYLGLDKRSGFFKVAQDKWSDEAVRIAFSYLDKSRSEPKADPLLDPDLDPKRSDGYSNEAKEIVHLHIALLNGAQVKYGDRVIGSISGVAPRLSGRQLNFSLVQKLIGRSARAAEENKKLSPEGQVKFDYVDLMGPPIPPELSEERRNESEELENKSSESP